MRPIVLDFDGSVGPLPDEIRVPLAHWQEKIRFGCSRRDLDRLDGTLDGVLRGQPCGPVFTGSGDFHHVSQPLIRRACALQRCRVVVFDNHPDNMRFPFGIHCGSWVSHVAALPNVARVDVVGITSPDVSAASLWENRLRPLYSGRVTYWCIRPRNRLARHLGLGAAFREFGSAEALLDAFAATIERAPLPVYVSIDKDVLAPEVVRTNWDQGVLREAHLTRTLQAVGDNRIGMDVTGEVSAHAYTTRWKRWLSARDQQPDVSATQAEAWRRDQHRINLNLLAALPQA